jgi:hypothetical protein
MSTKLWKVSSTHLAGLIGCHPAQLNQKAYMDEKFRVSFSRLSFLIVNSTAMSHLGKFDGVDVQHTLRMAEIDPMCLINLLCRYHLRDQVQIPPYLLMHGDASYTCVAFVYACTIKRRDQIKPTCGVYPLTRGS